jgi:polyhydroxyalkanoate synthesis regulator phasin
MTQQSNRPGGIGGIGEGIRTGVGVLNAFREAIEETISEAMEGSGEVTPERARALMKEATQRVQHSLEETRERLDLVARRELEELRREVDSLRARVVALEGGAGAPAELLGDASEGPDAGDHDIIIVPD